MKKFLVNLLIVFSLLLCGFISWQWYREARLRADLFGVQEAVREKQNALSELQGRVELLQAELTRLDGLKTELTDSLRTNRQEVLALNARLKQATAEAAKFSRQSEAFERALAQANENIKKQNELMKKAAEDGKRLAEERNAAIDKNNDMTRRYNELVTQYNQLQETLLKAGRTAGQ